MFHRFSDSPVLDSWSLPPALRFIVTGGVAALVHLGVVILLVDHAGLAPLVANVLGWLTAFGVSFAGHHWWTFAHQRAHWRSALPRFFMLSATGFGINETAYALALRFLPWRYDVLLVLVLGAVAVGTYVLSKWWAFHGARQLESD